MSTPNPFSHLSFFPTHAIVCVSLPRNGAHAYSFFSGPRICLYWRRHSRCSLHEPVDLLELKHSSSKYRRAGPRASAFRGGESSVSMLVLLVLVPVLELEGTKMDCASVSSKISATSSGSCVHGGMRGTVILSNLRTKAVVIVPRTGWG